MDDLKYDTVCDQFLLEFPQFREKYEKELDWWKGPDRPGQYIVFGLVIQPAVQELLASDTSPVLLHRIFDFFERMACSSDLQVPNLLGIELFERLVANQKNLGTAWQYMGKQTKVLARQTAKWRHCEKNLPRDWLSWGQKPRTGANEE
jgi:hypothetical protein